MKPDKIPTSEGTKTIPEILDRLMYGSYAANRDYGMTHEQLLSIGIGNEEMKRHYESKDFVTANKSKYHDS
jgi:hypothetical protein